MASIIGFPDPVDEISARLVAAGVVALAAAAIVLDQPWMTALLAYGFIARVLTGPKLSPLGLLVTRIVRPRLPAQPRYIPGPPKRFAQAVGAALTSTAAILALGFGLEGAAYAVLAVLIVAAGLEAFLGFCLGCKIFALLMHTGLVPKEVCERCIA